MVKTISPLIYGELLRRTSPDTICYKIRICTVDPGKTMCHLYPLPSALNELDWEEKSSQWNPPPQEYLERSHRGPEGMPWVCYIPGVKQLCQALVNVYDQLVPAVDLDGDKFSPAETLRGAIWRGRDCSDIRGDIYPGRRSPNGDRILDMLSLIHI